MRAVRLVGIKRPGRSQHVFRDKGTGIVADIVQCGHDLRIRQMLENLLGAGDSRQHPVAIVKRADAITQHAHKCLALLGHGQQVLSENEAGAGVAGFGHVDEAKESAQA